MSSTNMRSVDYREVPTDFPYGESILLDERWVDWGVCEELAVYLCRECIEAKASMHRSTRPVDILYKSYQKASALGWGEPAELRWVFRRVAALLNWPAPDVVRRP